MGVRWSRLSWNERNELWARWRRGQSFKRSREAEGGFPARCTTWLAQRGAWLRGSSLVACLCVPSAIPFAALLPPLAAKSREITDAGRIALPSRIDARERRLDVRSDAGWPADPRSVAQWWRSSRGNGRLSKSQAGFETRFRAILTCRCRPKRFIEVCSFRVAVS